HADSPSLDRIGKIVNQPLTGIARIDATVTGNRPELQINGTLAGNDLNYGDNGAVAISSDFTARVPELRAADAAGSAKAHATFTTSARLNRAVSGSSSTTALAGP